MEKKKISLDIRQFIHVKLDQLPNFALCHVGRCLGFKIEECSLLDDKQRHHVVQKLETFDYEDSENLKYKLRFVNPSSAFYWNLNQVQLAYGHLMMDREVFVKHLRALPDFEIDEFTPLNLTRSDFIPLIVAINNIGEKSIRTCSSRSDLKCELLRMSMTDRELRLSLVSWIMNLDEKKCRNLVTDRNRVTRSSDCSQSDQVLRLSKQCLPFNSEDAVKLAALKLRIDLSWMSEPIAEYLYFTERGTFINPLSRFLHQKYPDYYSLSNWFNPRLQVQAYNVDIIRNLTKKCELLLITDENIQLNMIRKFYTEYNFHLGFFPGCSDFTSPLDGINMLENHGSIILTYGRTIDHGNEVIFEYRSFTIQELYHSFQSCGSFISPWGEQFPPSAIIHLQKIAKNRSKQRGISRFDSEESNQRKLWFELNNLITHIRDFHELIHSRIEMLIEDNSDSKNEVVKILQVVLDLSLIMRGWDTKSERPIEVVPFSDVKMIEMIGTPYFDDYRMLLEKMSPGMRTIYENLPLLHNNEGAGQYKVSSDQVFGLTVHQKMTIIGDGEHLDDNAGCIRTASNWLLDSSHYYLTLLGCDPRFSTKNRREIR